jgi:hypothetical protein
MPDAVKKQAFSIGNDVPFNGAQTVPPFGDLGLQSDRYSARESVLLRWV